MFYQKTLELYFGNLDLIPLMYLPTSLRRCGSRGKALQTNEEQGTVEPNKQHNIIYDIHRVYVFSQIGVLRCCVTKGWQKRLKVCLNLNFNTVATANAQPSHFVPYVFSWWSRVQYIPYIFPMKFATWQGQKVNDFHCFLELPLQRKETSDLPVYNAALHAVGGWFDPKIWGILRLVH